MTVILVLATFLVFLVVDLAVNQHPAALRADARRRARTPTVRAPEHRVIAGFQVPETVRYHAGHSWVVPERKHVVRVGMDEFAAALAGPVERIELPKPGRWVRQGQKAWTLHRGDEQAEMLSPIEGEVLEVNSAVAGDPALVRKDPYKDGWLFTVFAPDDESSLRNLLPTGVVASWMRDAADRLYSLQPALAGPVAADGGMAAVDLLSGIEGRKWGDVTREFFLG